MAYILEGKREMNFPGNDGRQVQGVEIHIIQQLPVTSQEINGRLVETGFIPTHKPCYALAEQLPLGSLILPIRNKRGKIDDIFLISKPGDADYPVNTKK